MARIYLVFGPEGSTTRATCRLLMEAGCTGDDGWVQPFDRQPPKAADAPLAVWRKSVPHGRAWDRWPDIVGMVQTCYMNGYSDIRVIITVRDWHVLKRSQVRARHVKTLDEAEKAIRRAYLHIFGQLASMPHIPWYICPAAALTLHQTKATRGFLHEIGLDSPRRAMAFKDPDAKYYQGKA